MQVIMSVSSWMEGEGGDCKEDRFAWPLPGFEHKGMIMGEVCGLR